MIYFYIINNELSDNLKQAKNIKKDEIQQVDINANIYDTVQLIVDINGVTDSDLNSVQELLKKLFSSDTYSLRETELYNDEVDDLNNRKPGGLTVASRRRLIEKESVLRFFSKDENETEEISISRLFVSIKLDYKAAHSLSKKIELMNEIIKCFSTLEYFGIERITLSKINSIVCNSLFRMYQCFSKSMFGDVTYTLARQGKEIEQIFLKNENYFRYDENDINIIKIVQTGILNDDNKKKVYEGILNISACYDYLEYDDIDVETKIKELNSIIFEIFMRHITESFAEDLVFGNTNKVLGGFNNNEKI